MADFPPAPLKEDSRFFKISYVDNILRAETEGGYQISRPRTTGNPKRIITTGFLDITEADRIIMEQFYFTHSGSRFTYEIPTSGEEITVLLQGPPEAPYKGVGSNFRFNVTSITMREI